MFCPNCGQQIDEGSSFCTNCGTRLSPAPSVPTQEPVYQQEAQGYPPDEPTVYLDDSFNSTAPTYTAPNYNAPVYGPPQTFEGIRTGGEVQRLKSILSSSLFLVLCIVYSASILLGLFGASFDILGILFCISLWITYAAAKDRSAYLKTSGLRFSRGVVTAEWVLMWIAVGFVAVFGIFGVIISFSGSAALRDYSNGIGSFATAGMGIVILFFFLFAIAIMVLINIFFYGNLRKFCASLINSAESGMPAYVKANTSRIWLMVVGIIGCLSIFNLFSGAVVNSALNNLMRQYDELSPYAQYLISLTGIGVMGTIGSVGKAVTAILASVLLGKVAR